MPKLKKIDIEKLECADDKNLVYLWDSTLPGFGVRCTNAGVKSYVIRYRVAKKQRIKTLARVQVLDLSEAYKKAREKLSEAHGGEDPYISSTRDVQTVRELSEAFNAGRKTELKKSTRGGYVSLWKHINKAIGETAIVALDEQSVKKLKQEFAGKEASFNRALSLITSALKWQGVLTENHPLKRAKKFKEKTRQRILSRQENANFYKALGEYKRSRQAGWRYADLFILLLLTGLRRDEWRIGRWEWVEWESATYTLPDNKTGGRVVHLSSLAIDVLKDMALEQKSPKKGFIFPGPQRGKKHPISWTWRVWDNMRQAIGLDGFRIHDMRHTAGSYAHSVGKLTQRQVADFLGHHRLETSSRYIHDHEKKESAQIAAEAIAQDWNPHA